MFLFLNKSNQLLQEEFGSPVTGAENNLLFTILSHGGLTLLFGLYFTTLPYRDLT